MLYLYLPLKLHESKVHQVGFPVKQKRVNQHFKSSQNLTWLVKLVIIKHILHNIIGSSQVFYLKNESIISVLSLSKGRGKKIHGKGNKKEWKNVKGIDTTNLHYSYSPS